MLNKLILSFLCIALSSCIPHEREYGNYSVSIRYGKDYYSGIPIQYISFSLDD